MTEYELLMKSLKTSFEVKKTEKILEQFKAVVKENNLEYTPNILRDFLRLTELTFNPKSDKHYGEC